MSSEQKSLEHGSGGGTRIGVVIPTKGRSRMVSRCVAALLDGCDPATAAGLEIVVAVDGPDAGETAAVEAVLGAARHWPAQISVLDSAESAGPAAARNRAIEAVTAPLMLLLNDDVVPEPGLVAAHVRAHAERGADLPPAMVLGSAPWAVGERDRLFDRLVRETSMVFFYDRMTVEAAGYAGADDAAYRSHDWGFRHAWTLNLSVPTDAVRTVGGFDCSLPAAAFEDLELAWRLADGFGSPVLYRPEAVVEHEHFYEPSAYLEREARLGRDAVALEETNPACARDVFGRATGGRLLRDPEFLRETAEAVERDRGMVERLERSFLGLADLPADAVSGPHAGALLNTVYEHHLPVKRWWWRRGVLEAVVGDEVGVGGGVGSGLVA